MNRSDNIIKRWVKCLLALYEKSSIWNVVFFSFTISAALAILLIGISLYSRFSQQMEYLIREENQALIVQANKTLDSYLRNLMKVSDTLYYSVIKNKDLYQEPVTEEFQLLYDANKDYIENIVLFTGDGELIETAPAAKLKANVDPSEQEWFTAAMSRSENIHFSTPKLQNLFVKNDGQYRWVISVSRAVEITRGREISQGVLLMDIRYDMIEQVFDNISLGNNGYTYLVDREGTYIYHPKMQLIASGAYQDSILDASDLQDGNYEEIFQGEKRNITIKSVGYTGWKIVGVTPAAASWSRPTSGIRDRLFIVFLAAFFMYLLFVVNSYISSKITNPIKELEISVKELEGGDLNTQVYVGGTYEIQHLGTSIQIMARQIQSLMDDIVAEHESKRKSELDTLQSQINPHFLYNTLDIIVWMIENERQSEAVKVVTALARFFRISLSKGKTVIPVRDELEHVRNYLMIQKMRFKNRFEYEITADEQAGQLATIKLILQPLVENAIYHGMEYMDGDGLIRVEAKQKGEDLLISIEDNGLGMPQDVADTLLTRETSEKEKNQSRKGSGIGLKNVHERIRLYFGQDYGLQIFSEPDEGTRIVIRLPAVPYEEWEKKDML